MRAAEDGIAGTRQSAAYGPSCMRALIAVSSTMPRRESRCSCQDKTSIREGLLLSAAGNVRDTGRRGSTAVGGRVAGSAPSAG